MPAALTGSSWRTEEIDVPSYLDLLGVRRARPSLELLEALHDAHVRTLPFTNADILLGTYPGIAPAAVQRQLIERRRGGYCFAHGQLMAAALEDLGFEVARHLGRVGSPDSARTHMSLAVRIDGQEWFADPGFGFSVRGPILLEDGASRDEGGRRFELRRGGEGAGETWTLRRDGELLHITDRLPVRPVDVHTGDRITSGGLAPGPFTVMLMANRWTEHGHVSITDSTRVVRADGRPTQHEEISPREAVEATAELGVALSAAERAALEDVLIGLRRRREAEQKKS
ncbi:arylamine N-acetyltransferase [Kocuria palustris]|uniref:arylamine N-acetyltransferase family protein n=1 Tax=Kocuria palustris TaxID=71999 RepID=UPI0011AAE988|nr:arylamine N-acetyltransferase [Kocuria palustris]